MYFIVSRLFIIEPLESCLACYASIMQKKIHNLANVEMLLVLFSPVKLSIKQQAYLKWNNIILKLMNFRDFFFTSTCNTYEWIV